jgi:hypothetical protein
MREGDHLKDSGVDGRMILKWIFERLDGGHRLNRCGSGQGQVAGCCKCGDEASGSQKELWSMELISYYYYCYCLFEAYNLCHT